MEVPLFTLSISRCFLRSTVQLALLTAAPRLLQMLLSPVQNHPGNHGRSHILCPENPEFSVLALFLLKQKGCDFRDEANSNRDLLLCVEQGNLLPGYVWTVAGYTGRRVLLGLQML